MKSYSRLLFALSAFAIPAACTPKANSDLARAPTFDWFIDRCITKDQFREDSFSYISLIHPQGSRLNCETKRQCR
jgi:hypothetical protein